MSYLGKYRGMVVSNVDPEQRGRLLVQVPDVAGLVPTTWALPCVPFAGKQSGMWVLPQIGSGVWVEFEQGNPDYPIWVGCWWPTAGHVPATALAAAPGLPNVVLQTSGQKSLILSDLPGGLGITLKDATGAMIMINETGITISNGRGATIMLTGPTVNINTGALVVT
jgi:uncharacterized protein involved in type VI secretion and phage assembly